MFGKPATLIGRPGAKGGPCLDETCGCPSCSHLRGAVTEKCRSCAKALGYGRAFYPNFDGPGIVHESCVSKEWTRSVVRSEHGAPMATIFGPMRWKLWLSCGHIRFWRRLAKSVECSICRELQRDRYGNRRLSTPAEIRARLRRNA